MDVIPDRTKKRTIITPDGAQPDRLMDDSALVYLTEQGLVIMTGCSHAGIVNTIAYARKVCARQRIRDVVGGLHLKESDRGTLDATVSYMKTIGPAALHPCHCTSLAAKIALAGVAPVGETGVGMRIEY
jgi:7,8-dihydropterin-6-yl-methyl-4-(beta-D-ribofuranosyl)aminobenzene 5'-phosphate synthase